MTLMVKRLEFLFSVFLIFFIFAAEAAEKRDYISYTITYNENSTPIVHLPINGKLVPLIIDTGAMGMGLSLDKEVIESFEELDEIGVDRYTDLTGKVTNVKQYKLPELLIDGFRFSNLVINEYYPWGLYSEKSSEVSKNDQIKGVIGIQLLKQYPVILDFIHNKFLLLSSTKVVPEAIYERDTWRKVKFAINANGIEISATFGSNNNGKLDLDSASNISIIKPHMVPHSEINYNCELLFKGEDRCRFYLAKELKLDNLSFGQQQFIIYGFTEPSSSGILGFDYLNGKMLFLDIKNKYMLVKTA
jgi:hypothetical protein